MKVNEQLWSCVLEQSLEGNEAEPEVAVAKAWASGRCCGGLCAGELGVRQHPDCKRRIGDELEEASLFKKEVDDETVLQKESKSYREFSWQVN